MLWMQSKMLHARELQRVPAQQLCLVIMGLHFDNMARRLT